jgi:hypothetical protein
MKISKLTVIITIICLLSPAACFALSGNTGTTAGAFLKLISGVRAAAMGNTFVAIADDPSAIYCNPAGLSQIKSAELSSEYASWFSGTSYTALSYVKPFDSSNTGGIAVNYLNMGEMEETTPAQPSGTGRMFTASASMVTLAYSRRMNPVLSLGMAANVFNENIDNSAATGYAANISLLFNLSKKFNAGFSVKNIGNFSGIDNPLPLLYMAGIAYKPNDRLTLASDVNIPNDNQITLHLGAEYSFNDLLFVRIGYNTRSEENAGGNYGVGAGFKWDILQLDYAYVPYQDLGNTYRVSFNLNL